MILTVMMCSVNVYATAEYPRKRGNVLVRDPYILTHDGKYYMYGTCLSNGKGYGCCISEDLENWSDNIQIFTPDEDSDMEADFWAPECHYYNGNFYLFATYRSKASGKRGTAIFKSDSPTGPFALWSDGHITPKEIDCIDGTLYIDKEGRPWMVYVNEWTSSPDEVGEMAAARLSEDLRSFISEPIMLFRAQKHIWATGKITDGPTLYRTENGRLIMLWSNISKSGGYAVGMAVSDNGEIDGNWIHYPEAFYEMGGSFEFDGGHPMIFYTLDGKLIMSIHSPNSSSEYIFETAHFFELEDTGNMLIIKDKYTYGDVFYRIFFEIYYALIKMWYMIF
ncbi:MAG: family 43 glycosylhydrolase [Clostridia bacterium]|nr:family 43 glycosylhydrolase [Clostridia bacterium]